jgi:uncharacterized membrane protein
MPLSEYERQVLDEIEHDLADGSTRPGRWTARTRRPVLRSLGGAVGLLLIVLGIRMADGAGVFVAVVGYALTVLVTASAVTAARRRRGRPR